MKRLVVALWVASCCILPPPAGAAATDVLVAAAVQGDNAAVRALLKQGHDVNVVAARRHHGVALERAGR